MLVAFCKFCHAQGSSRLFILSCLNAHALESGRCVHLFVIFERLVRRLAESVGLLYNGLINNLADTNDPTVSLIN